MKNKEFNLQRFAAEANLTKQADIEPAISIDHVNHIQSNIDELRTVLGIANMTPMANGTQIKIYKTELTKKAAQVGEGETIPLSKVERKLARTVSLELKKYRKATSAESVQRNGYDNAVNITDGKLISAIQKDIKTDFYALLESGTATVEGTNLQTACANAWAKLQGLYEDESVEAIYFVNSLDAADYLGNASITMQTAGGLKYLEDFLSLGTLIVSPSVQKGTVKATVKENLAGAYIPANSSDLARAFGLTSDATGYVGMTHTPQTGNATVETLIMSGTVFYPERLDGIVKASLSVPETSTPKSEQ